MMNKLCIPFLFYLIIMLSGLFCYAKENNSLRTIYVSQQFGVDEENDGSDINTPVKTLARARVIALRYHHTTDAFQILLRGGEQFDEFIPMSNQVLTGYDPLRNTFAFVWDINKPLLFSTYGSSEKALLYCNKYTFEGGPQAAIAITTPSAENVTIQNIHFKRWQVCALFAYKTKNIQILDNIVEEIGTYYFPDETAEGIYGAGAIYPKNSHDVVIKNNYIRNIHNQFDMLDKMHVFYMTRLSDSEVSHNIVVNASGPPLKFRRSQTNHVYVHDNEFYYTGPSKSLNQVQEGWVRYSGDAGDGCPYALIIENNTFYYPFCWDDRENCTQAVATKCSISNTSVCGQDACENEDKIKWINNDFRYNWEEKSVPPLPTSVKGESYAASNMRPVQFTLYQNNPNPFAHVSTIRYNLFKPVHVKIIIFDLMGRQKKILLNQFKTDGYHSLKWDGKDQNNRMLPNGLYLCKLQVGEQVKTIKMVLLMK